VKFALGEKPISVSEAAARSDVAYARMEHTHGPSPLRSEPRRAGPAVDRLSIASLHVPGHVVFVISDLQGDAFEQVAQSLAGPVSSLAALPHDVVIAGN
jgi:hypothetical protein